MSLYRTDRSSESLDKDKLMYANFITFEPRFNSTIIKHSQFFVLIIQTIEQYLKKEGNEIAPYQRRIGNTHCCHNGNGDCEGKARYW